MKGLIIGNWKWEIYEKALYDGFHKNNIDIHSFKIIDYKTFFKRIQYKFKLGPLINQINKNLINIILKNNYDFIFFYRPIFIKSSTIKTIQKSTTTKVVCYHNDNPFRQKLKYVKYYRFFNILSYCDIVYVYRPSNIQDAFKYGAKFVKLLMPYYVVGLHDQNYITKKEYDVIFIGHYEKDGRDEIINFLVKNNINVSIYGSNWHKSKLDPKYYNPPVYGKEYVKQLQKSKIALVFFSKLNKDVYTRRNFEIPATKTFMLSEYSPALLKYFQPGIDMDIFKNKEELLKKILLYLSNDNLRKKIINQAYIKNIPNNNIQSSLQILNDLNNIS